MRDFRFHAVMQRLTLEHVGSFIEFYEAFKQNLRMADARRAINRNSAQQRDGYAADASFKERDHSQIARILDKINDAFMEQYKIPILEYVSSGDDEEETGFRWNASDIAEIFYRYCRSYVNQLAKAERDIFELIDDQKITVAVYPASIISNLNFEKEIREKNLGIDFNLRTHFVKKPGDIEYIQRERANMPFFVDELFPKELESLFNRDAKISCLRENRFFLVSNYDLSSDFQLRSSDDREWGSQAVAHNRLSQVGFGILDDYIFKKAIIELSDLRFDAEKSIDELFLIARDQFNIEVTLTRISDAKALLMAGKPDQVRLLMDEKMTRELFSPQEAAESGLFVYPIIRDRKNFSSTSAFVHLHKLSLGISANIRQRQDYRALLNYAQSAEGSQRTSRDGPAGRSFASLSRVDSSVSTSSIDASGASAPSNGERPIEQRRGRINFVHPVTNKVEILGDDGVTYTADKSDIIGKPDTDLHKRVFFNLEYNREQGSDVAVKSIIVVGSELTGSVTNVQPMFTFIRVGRKSRSDGQDIFYYHGGRGPSLKYGDKVSFILTENSDKGVLKPSTKSVEIV